MGRERKNIIVNFSTINGISIFISKANCRPSTLGTKSNNGSNSAL